MAIHPHVGKAAASRKAPTNELSGNPAASKGRGVKMASKGVTSATFNHTAKMQQTPDLKGFSVKKVK